MSGNYHKELCYCKRTAWRTMLVNWCYSSGGMGVRMISNSKSDLQGNDVIW